MSIYVCAIFSFPSYTVYNWQRHLSSAEDYTNMSYYNLCGNGSQHCNISKGGGTYKKITGMQDSSPVDRNKNLTMNRCP